MIIAIGVDIIEIRRIEEAFADQGERFRARVFTQAEADYCEARADKYASYAARFAAKEAVMKALGTGWAEGVAWREIEVVCNPSGAPALELSGRARARFLELKASKAHLSLSHSRETAVAQVVLEG